MRLHPPALSIFRKTGNDGASLAATTYRQMLDRCSTAAIQGVSRKSTGGPTKLLSADKPRTRLGVNEHGSHALRCWRSVPSFTRAYPGKMASQSAKTILSVLVSSFTFDIDSELSLPVNVSPSHAPA
jgi:hypothetical protein